MKKMTALILLLCMVLSLSACGKVEITMQDIYNAVKTETLFKNHQSVRIQDEMDGEIWYEEYHTKDYFFKCMLGEESNWAEFMSDNAYYCHTDGVYVLYLSLTPDGLSDFAGERAEKYETIVLGEDCLEEAIETVTQKDGRITVKGSVSSKALEALAGEGVTSGQFEHVLDAKTRELLSITSDYTYEDGTTYHSVTRISYDVEGNENLKTFLAYESQTENLRNITVVNNPGTEKELSQSVQVPKGLILGFNFDDEWADAVAFYTDAACTVSYDPYADTDSDLTIYVKWSK